MGKKYKWLIALLVLAVAIWGMGQYDYARLVRGEQPMFARYQLHLMDGGSVQYVGFGYAVTERHEMRWGIEMSTEERFTSKQQIAPFRVGPTLDYWTPFVSRENTRFIVETNR